MLDFLVFIKVSEPVAQLLKRKILPKSALGANTGTPTLVFSDEPVHAQGFAQ